MPTYIALLKWTPQGLKDVKQSPSRLDAARKGFQAAGVTMKTFYMTMGQYDMVAVVEAPDDATLAKAILTAAAQGSVVSETCRAFTEDEYRKILGGLSWQRISVRQEPQPALRRNHLICAIRDVDNIRHAGKARRQIRLWSDSPAPGQ